MGLDLFGRQTRDWKGLGPCRDEEGRLGDLDEQELVDGLAGLEEGYEGLSLVDEIYGISCSDGNKWR